MTKYIAVTAFYNFQSRTIVLFKMYFSRDKKILFNPDIDFFLILDYFFLYFLIGLTNMT